MSHSKADRKKIKGEIRRGGFFAVVDGRLIDRAGGENVGSPCGKKYAKHHASRLRRVSKHELMQTSMTEMREAQLLEEEDFEDLREEQFAGYEEQFERNDPYFDRYNEPEGSVYDGYDPYEDFDGGPWDLLDRP